MWTYCKQKNPFVRLKCSVKIFKSFTGNWNRIMEPGNDSFGRVLGYPAQPLSTSTRESQSSTFSSVPVRVQNNVLEYWY